MHQSNDLRMTHIGGPTLLIEFGGLRLLTDPTFDPHEQDYITGPVTLSKIADPATDASASERSTPSCSATIIILATEIKQVSSALCDRFSGAPSDGRLLAQLYRHIPQRTDQADTEWIAQGEQLRMEHATGTRAKSHLQVMLRENP
jgi:hypothetical protein